MAGLFVRNSIEAHQLMRFSAGPSGARQLAFTHLQLVRPRLAQTTAPQGGRFRRPWLHYGARESFGTRSESIPYETNGAEVQSFLYQAVQGNRAGLDAHKGHTERHLVHIFSQDTQRRQRLSRARDDVFASDAQLPGCHSPPYS